MGAKSSKPQNPDPCNPSDGTLLSVGCSKRSELRHKPWCTKGDGTPLSTGCTIKRALIDGEFGELFSKRDARHKPWCPKGDGTPLSTGCTIKRAIIDGEFGELFSKRDEERHRGPICSKLPHGLGCTDKRGLIDGENNVDAKVLLRTETVFYVLAIVMLLFVFGRQIAKYRNKKHQAIKMSSVADEDVEKGLLLTNMVENGRLKMLTFAMQLTSATRSIDLNVRR